jgi:hypothetical protein
MVSPLINRAGKLGVACSSPVFPLTGWAEINEGNIENADKAKPDFRNFLRSELLIIKNNKTSESRRLMNELLKKIKRWD